MEFPSPACFSAISPLFPALERILKLSAKLYDCWNLRQETYVARPILAFPLVVPEFWTWISGAVKAFFLRGNMVLPVGGVLFLHCWSVMTFCSHGLPGSSSHCPWLPLLRTCHHYGHNQQGEQVAGIKSQQWPASSLALALGCRWLAPWHQGECDCIPLAHLPLLWELSAPASMAKGSSILFSAVFLSPENGKGEQWQ